LTRIKSSDEPKPSRLASTPKARYRATRAERNGRLTAELSKLAHLLRQRNRVLRVGAARCTPLSFFGGGEVFLGFGDRGIEGCALRRVHRDLGMNCRQPLASGFVALTVSKEAYPLALTL
jgi:hypothetical protein